MRSTGPLPACAPPLTRLEAALGRDFADRLVAALSGAVEGGSPRS